MVGAIVLGLKTTAATTGQLNASHSRQELAAFFTTDVQSAVTIADETSTDTTTCMAAGETLVGRLSWTDIDSTGASTARVVTYAIVTVSGDKQLVRHACTGGAMSPSPSSTTSSAATSTARAPRSRRQPARRLPAPS